MNFSFFGFLIELVTHNFSMTFELSFTELQKEITDFQSIFIGQFPLESGETLLHIPPFLGNGYVRGLRLREGLDLCVQEHVLKHDLVLHFQNLSVHSACASLAFCLSGRYSATYTDSPEFLWMGAGDANFCTIPDAAGITYFKAEEHMHMVDLIISPTQMISLVGEELAQLPLNFQTAIRSGLAEKTIHFCDASAEITQTLLQIIHCPYHGKIRRVYLEGKALELVALYFSQFCQSSNSASPASWERQDMEQLHKARWILKHNLMTPPSLAELSTQVGLNEHKLQEGFRKLFGTTVFGVLHNDRMECARHLLETRQMSIGAIAEMVGLPHRGYFAKAFKRKFGIVPREYIKKFN
ncbi:MAG: AraC family transcriptional regulator [Cyanobacteria bacterium P01_H01_bin.15]